MQFDLIKYVPPILQLIALVIIGLFVILSFLGRFNKTFGEIVFWSEERNTVVHFLEYTLTPLVVFVVLTVIVTANWNSSSSFWGELSWWKTTGKKVGVVILGIIPSVLFFLALFPLTKLADLKNSEKPLATIYGKLYVVSLILSILFLPLGIFVAIFLDKYFSAK